MTEVGPKNRFKRPLELIDNQLRQIPQKNNERHHREVHTKQAVFIIIINCLKLNQIILWDKRWQNLDHQSWTKLDGQAHL